MFYLTLISVGCILGWKCSGGRALLSFSIWMVEETEFYLFREVTSSTAMGILNEKVAYFEGDT